MVSKENYIVVNEGFLKSAAKDVVTFAILFVMFWLNYEFIGNNWIVHICIFIMFLVGLSAIRRKEYTLEEAITYLESRRKKE